MQKLFASALVALIGLPALAASPSFDLAAAGLWSADGAAQETERRRPRVPGGSGCDDPRDLIEHPECR